MVALIPIRPPIKGSKSSGNSKKTRAPNITYAENLTESEHRISRSPLHIMPHLEVVAFLPDLTICILKLTFILASRDCLESHCVPLMINIFDMKQSGLNLRALSERCDSVFK